MSNPAKLTIAALALAALVVAFVVARPADEQEPAQTPPASAADTSPQGPADVPATQSTPSEPAEPRPDARIRVRGGGPAGEVRTVAVRRGDEVRLAFRSDAPGEVHIHGVDEYVDLEAGRTVTATFEAEAEGIYEIEHHGTGRLLATLQVEPR